jgi:drug/metabolite transporter (DMT)-like permease
MDSFRRLPVAARGIVLMILAIVIFTLMDALAKSLLSRHATLQVVWARYTGQTVIVALLLLRVGLHHLRAQHPWLQVWRSLFQFGASVFFFASLNYIGLAEATAIADLNPVLITLGAVLFLGEKIGLRRAVGIVVALAGAMLIIKPGSSVFSVAALLPLGCGICFAGYALITRAVGARESVWTSLAYTALFGTLVTSASLPWVWETPAWSDVPGFVVIGLMGATAQLFLIRSYAMAEASVVAPFSYLGLVCAMVWGWLFFGQLPDQWSMLGALVIVGAGLYVWHRETRATRLAAAGGSGQKQG